MAPKSLIPVKAIKNNGGSGGGFKTKFQKPLATVHHHVDLAWAFTDFKVQGLTWKEGEKLILSLNKSTALKNLNIKTISVCLSRVTRLEDLQILPIDLDDPESPETEHLRKLRQDKYTKYWQSGYREDGTWDADELQSVQEARRRALKVKFANENINKLPKGDRDSGLTYWLGRFDIRAGSTSRFICYRARHFSNFNANDTITDGPVEMNKPEMIRRLRKYWDPTLRTKRRRGGASPVSSSIV